MIKLQVGGVIRVNVLWESLGELVRWDFLIGGSAVGTIALPVIGTVSAAVVGGIGGVIFGGINGAAAC